MISLQNLSTTRKYIPSFSAHSYNQFALDSTSSQVRERICMVFARNGSLTKLMWQILSLEKSIYLQHIWN